MMNFAKGKVSRIILAVMLVLLAVIPFMTKEYVITVLINILLICFLSQCWNLIGGYGGQLAMGHSLYYGIGGYVSTLLLTKAGLTPWIGMIIGAIVSAFIAAALGMLIFRYKIKGVFFALISIAFCEIAKGLVNNSQFMGTSIGILLPLENNPKNFMFFDKIYYYYILFILMIIMLVISSLLERSKFGYNLMAIRNNEEAAAASGINVNKNKIMIYALSAFMTALGGTFYAQYMLYITPDLMFNTGLTNEMIISTLIGGRATVLGPVIGSFMYNLFGELLRNLSFGAGTKAATVTNVLYGLILIIVALYLPNGFVKIKDQIKLPAAWRKKVKANDA